MTILRADARSIPLPDNSVHCVITSPPYFALRDYGVAGQIGLEPTPAAYVATMVAVFEEVKRVLRDDGTAWCNIGDSYANDTKWGGESGSKNYTSAAGGYGGQRVKRDTGLKPKDLCLIPERLAIALQDAGWYVRSRICWAKRAPMPESVTDRPTSAWEHIWLLSKSSRYYYDAEAVREAHEDSNTTRLEALRQNGGALGQAIPGATIADNPRITQSRHRGLPGVGTTRGAFNPAGRNLRNFWLLGPENYAAAHFATFPTAIPRRAILAGTSAHGCCSSCGAPWARVVEREAQPPVTFNHKFSEDDTQFRTRPTGNGRRLAAWRSEHPAVTDWRPSCDCAAPVIPCTVLDPFSGSGTTVAVAQELGRNGIGLELNPEYIRLAEQRIAAAPVPLFACEGIEVSA